MLDSPSLLLTPQSETAVLDLVEFNERLKELWVGFGVPEVATKEASKLHETVQTASSDHVKQFFGGELGGCGHDGARPMAQQADQLWASRRRLAYTVKLEG